MIIGLVEINNITTNYTGLFFDKMSKLTVQMNKNGN